MQTLTGASPCQNRKTGNAKTITSMRSYSLLQRKVPHRALRGWK